MSERVFTPAERDAVFQENFTLVNGKIKERKHAGFPVSIGGKPAGWIRREYRTGSRARQLPPDRWSTPEKASAWIDMLEAGATG